MAKFQVPTVGGIRKVIKQTKTDAGTTIAEFGSNTVTLAQLRAALDIPTTSGGGSGGTSASLILGPGLSGGGPLVGPVKVNLTAPIPVGLWQDQPDDPIMVPPGTGMSPAPPPQSLIAPQPAPVGMWIETFDDPLLTFPVTQPPATGGSVSFANPTASLGLTAVNGAATTAMRSDAAPALSQAIAPTWTALHTFAPASGKAIQVNGVAQAGYLPTVKISVVNTTDQSNGLNIVAGTSVNDANLVLQNAAATFNYFALLGDSSWSFARPTGVGTLACDINGAVTISAPAAGAALTLNAHAGAVALQTNSAAGQNCMIGWTQSGQLTWLAYEAASSNTFAIWNSSHGDTMQFTGAGNVTILAPGSGVALSATGVAGSYTESLTGSSTSGQSYGLLIQAGTTSGDLAVNVIPASGAVNFFMIFGDGSGQLGNGGRNINWNPAGNFVVQGPSSGYALTVNAGSGACLHLDSGTAAYEGFSVSGTFAGYVGTAGILSGASGGLVIRAEAGPLWFTTDGGVSTAMKIDTTHAVTISAPSSGQALTVNGLASSIVAVFASGTASNVTSGDLQVTRAGSTANTLAQGPNLYLLDTTNTHGTILQHSGGQTEIWQLNSGWLEVGQCSTGQQWQFYEPNFSAAGLKKVATWDNPTATVTLHVGTATTTGTMNFIRSGASISIYMSADLKTTSNGTTMTITGLPAMATPAVQQSTLCDVYNNNAQVVGLATITGTTITFAVGTAGFNGSGFTNGGTNGLPGGSVITYALK